jgi:hypothetical protein
VKGKKNGKGNVLFMQSGNKFEGEFKDNSKNGYGKMHWVN